MDNHSDQPSENRKTEKKKSAGARVWLWISLGATGLLAIILIFGFDISIKPRSGSDNVKQSPVAAQKQSGKNLPGNISSLAKEVLPAEGVVIPVAWNDLGKQMVKAGVIDKEKFIALYNGRGGLDEETKQLLLGSNNGKLKINARNSGVILNLLWAFGLANKNPILENGPMQNPKYGGDAGRFASTGGWTLAKSNAMDYYSKYGFVKLTGSQQALVEKISRGIFRPCCNNPTYFPDCNHGMAMLGLLELLSAQGLNENEIYKTALEVNSYWFPSTYLTIARYFAKQGVDWKDVNPKEVLSSAYSSASGYRRVLSEVGPSKTRGGGGCGV